MTVQSEFFDALDKMVAANPQNSRKSAPVVEWFSTHFGVRGRASVVNEAKQSYNRVKEQFAHLDAHVVFVSTDKAAVKPLLETAKTMWYPALTSVLILQRDASGNYGPGELLETSSSVVTAIYTGAITPLQVTTLVPPAAGAPSSGSATPPPPAVKVVAANAVLTWDAASTSATSGLVGLDRVIALTISALKSGRHVVLLGPPGTGKTRVALEVSKVVGATAEVCTATSEWTTFETIGGYFPALEVQSGSTAPAMDFSPGVVTRSIERNHWLVIDELNRADVDKAFGELFTLLSGTNVRLPHRKLDEGTYKEILFAHQGTEVDPDSFVIAVPFDWRLIGTMNTFDKASLYQLSYAFMRRFAFIQVDPPNETDYRQILDAAAARETIDAALQPWWNQFLDRMKELFAGGSARSLRSIGLGVGPAIAIDCLAYGARVMERADFQQTGEGLGELGLDVISALLLPQMEGREANHQELHNALVQVLGLSAGQATQLDARLAAWTGAEI